MSLEEKRTFEIGDTVPLIVPPKYDPVNHPPHYTKSASKCSHCSYPIECIDVTRNFNFNIGNAIKYLWRCELKGATIEDLKKAIWYIQDEIKQKEKTA